MESKKVEPQNLTDGLVRSLKARLAAEEGKVAVPANAKPHLFAAAPIAAAATSPLVVSPTSEDLSDISMRHLLEQIVAHYNSAKTQHVARDALTELQIRLKQDNQIFGAVQIHEELRCFYNLGDVQVHRGRTYYCNADDMIPKKKLWLTIISPEVKLCVALLEASRNILDPDWHNKGTGTLGFTGRTPDTIKDCRKLIIDSRLLDDSRYDPNFKDDKFVFSFKGVEKLMRELHQRVSIQTDKKYDTLKALLNKPFSIEKAPKDFEACLALFEPHYPQIQYK